jgi:alpha-1,3/alpha-1,6-mannosyltransferase
VKVYTPFFDPNRCFKEAREQLDVEVHGSWFPRAIAGRMIALCAYLRMILCAIWVLLFGGHYDYYILDQVSFPVPLLRLRQRNVLFYCHYPDKLLSTDRRSFIKRFYRFFLDLIEEITTGLAKCIVVNSLFTQKVFLDNFPLIRKWRRYKPEVVYPSIDEKGFIKNPAFRDTIEDLLGGRKVSEKTVILTSLNRYERKKNIPLALESFAYYINNEFKKSKQEIEPVLVIAGGWDNRLSENVDVHNELVQSAKLLGISDKVVFLRSISND